MDGSGSVVTAPGSASPAARQPKNPCVWCCGNTGPGVGLACAGWPGRGHSSRRTQGGPGSRYAMASSRAKSSPVGSSASRGSAGAATDCSPTSRTPGPWSSPSGSPTVHPTACRGCQPSLRSPWPSVWSTPTGRCPRLVRALHGRPPPPRGRASLSAILCGSGPCAQGRGRGAWPGSGRPAATGACWWPGSEERRVGKECRSRWSPYH